MKHLKLFFLLLLPFIAHSQPNIQGFQLGWGFVRGTFDELDPGSDLDDATQASLNGRACQCGSVFLQNLSTQQIFGETQPIGDDLVNGIYIVTGNFTIQADQWQFGEVIEVPLPCSYGFSGTALNFQVIHVADPNNPKENDQLSCVPGDECRLRKGYLNTWQEPNVNAGLDDLICIGESLQLNATGATDYVWSPSSSLDAENISNPIATPVSTTNYEVEGSVTHTYNPPGSPSSYSRTCKSTDNVLVTVDDGPDLTLPTEHFICNDDEVEILDAGNNPNASYSWTWQNPSGTVGIVLGNSETQQTVGYGVYSGAPYGTYSVSATSVNGCESEASTEVIPLTAEFDISFTESGGNVQFTLTDLSAHGQTHYWSIARGAEQSCAKDGPWMETSAGSNTIYTSSWFPLGAGKFYLSHGEITSGCWSPATLARCVEISARPLRGGGTGYVMTEYGGGSKSNMPSPLSSKASPELSIYPNPFSDQIKISTDFSSNDLLEDLESASVFTANGMMLKQIDAAKTSSEENSLKIDLSGLSSGMYFLRLKYTDGSVQTEKIIKQK